MRRKNNAFVIGLYALAAFFLFAILRYVFFFRLGFNPAADDAFVIIRVFFSGPILVLLGIFLSLKFHHLVHRIFGICFLLIGIGWIIELIRTVIEEAA